MHGAFLFPVVSEGKPIGVLVFHSREVREPEDRLLQAVRMIGGQIGQFVQRKRAEERVQHMATHDALTSLPNRMMFAQLLDHEIQVAQRYRRSFAVMFIDLDRFKIVNRHPGARSGRQAAAGSEHAFQGLPARERCRLAPGRRRIRGAAAGGDERGANHHRRGASSSPPP